MKILAYNLNLQRNIGHLCKGDIMKAFLLALVLCFTVGCADMVVRSGPYHVYALHMQVYDKSYVDYIYSAGIPYIQYNSATTSIYYRDQQNNLQSKQIHKNIVILDIKDNGPVPYEIEKRDGEKK